MSATKLSVPDTPEAKLWELLRRNRRFRRTVARMRTHFDRFESGSPAQRGEATMAGRRILDSRPLKGNLFAQTAIQWLVPQPLFIVREAVARDDQVGTPAKGVVLEFSRMGWGSTPHQDDPTWRWVESRPGPFGSVHSQANHLGWPLRWGPRLTRTIVKDHRIPNSFPDEIAEWEDWSATHPFTVDSPWNEAPPGFRREWNAYWRQCSGSEMAAAETNFFQGWNPWDVVRRSIEVVRTANQCIQGMAEDLDQVREGAPEPEFPRKPTLGGGSMRRIPKLQMELSEMERVRLLQFTELTRHRVVVLPPLMSRGAAKAVLKRYLAHLEKKLPDTREILGTRSAWEAYIGFEQHRVKGSADFGESMGAYFRSRVRGGTLMQFGISPQVRDRWIKDGVVRPLPDNAKESDAVERREVEKALRRAATDDRLRNREIERWVRFLDELSVATYPTLDINKLERKTPS